MKKAVLIFAALLLGGSALAQQVPGVFYVGPKAGVISSTVIGDYGVQTSRNDFHKISFTAGVFGGYDIIKWLGVGLEVNYSRQGSLAKTAYEGHNIEFRELLQYINVPVVARFYPFENLAFYTGVQFGFLVGANDYLTYDDQSVDYDNRSSCFDTEVAIPIGVSYTFLGKIHLDVRYTIGLTDVYKPHESQARNSVFALTLGYRFDI